MNFGRRLFFLSVLSAVLLFPRSGNCFYQYDSEPFGLDLRGSFLIYGIGTHYPDAPLIFPETGDESWGAVGRLLGHAKIGRRVTLDANVLEAAGSVTGEQLQRAPVGGIERSGLLLRNQHHSPNARAFTALDAFQVQWTSHLMDITAGRQPVNLATTFYFAPNDFFAPYAAQEFYRVYKPGVDGVRAEIRLGELSQLSLISVLGYRPDAETDNGWSKEPDWHRTSMLARVSTTVLDFDWALLGGVVHDTVINGGAIQGELFDWLGIRAEGHYGRPEDDADAPYAELTAGMEHRFASSLDVRMEYFYHGRGFSSISQANSALLSRETVTPYLGRNYLGFGMGYEFTPLLTGQMLVLANLTDGSQLATGNLVYSLSDESELVLTLSVPFGDKPQGLAFQSEYGSLPKSALIEYRVYF